MVMAPHHRRHSTVSYTTHPAPVVDTYQLPGSLKIKFRRKGSLSAGISLREAQDHYIRLSCNDYYSLYDFHADSHSRILLRIQARIRALTENVLLIAEGLLLVGWLRVNDLRYPIGYT